MPFRFRHLPILLAVATLAACSADSITGAPATSELPQPRPNFSVTYASASDPSLLRQLAREKRRVDSVKVKADREYWSVARDWYDLWRADTRGEHTLVYCAPLPYVATTKIVGPAGGTLNFGVHKLEIPRGALAGYAVITAEMPTSLTVSARFSPHGTTFLVPPKLTLSYKHCNRPISAFEHVVYTDGVGGSVLEVPPSWDDALNERVYGWLSHFSIYALAE